MEESTRQSAGLNAYPLEIPHWVENSFRRRAVHKAMAQRKRHATQGTGDMLKPTIHTGRVVELNFGVGDF